jgi:phosphomevalonate kinase
MTGLVASAPGKLFLCGEYAVLEGAPAVLTAVDRRAVARVASTARRASPIVAAVFDEVTAWLPEHARGDGSAPPIAIQTRGFTRGRAKIGLGSSAAVAVAATALLIAREKGFSDVHGDRVLEIALAAHRKAQGGRGSGADVAAAVHGGTIRYEMGAPVSQLGPVPAAIAFVWTGRPASTIELLTRVHAFALAAPAEHGALLGDLAALATALAAAYVASDTNEIIRLTGAYGAMMARLGEAAGAPIVRPAHDRVARLAAAHGGAGKPSGAGGGDVAMAVFARAEERDRFAIAAAKDGLPVLNLRCHERGVEVSGL